ncbi:recombinase family protein [Acidithiobacillus sp. YTS05]|nr:recombinase family protein [Acidithiobacillus sp. YTS05]
MARFVLYARRSLDTDPSAEEQFAILRERCAAAGHEVVDEYVDENVEAKAARDPRPKRDRAIYDAMRGGAEGIAIVSLDRLARSVGDLEELLRELAVAGAGLYVADLELDTLTPDGAEFLQAVSAVVAFDRAVRVEALRRGHRKARAKGVRIGPPRTSRGLEDKIASLLRAGVKPSRIRTITRVGISAISRIKREMAAAEAAADAALAAEDAEA